MNMLLNRICAEYLRIFPQEAARIKELTDQVAEKSVAELRSRSNFDKGHLTAAAFLVAPQHGKILLLEHLALGMWLQPGGHVEPGDVTSLAAALREVHEETGLNPDELRYLPLSRKDELVPLDIDINVIPASTDKREPAHHHYDFRYLFLVPEQKMIKIDEKESADARWVPLPTFATMNNGEFTLVAHKISMMLALHDQA